jgi:hypothetical protein
MATALVVGNMDIRASSGAKPGTIIASDAAGTEFAQAARAGAGSS